MPITREEFSRLPDPAKTKKDIEACIMKMRTQAAFLEGCRQYVNTEKRDGAYVVALEYAKKHEDSLHGVLYAALTLVLAWGTRFYSSRMKQVQLVLDDLSRLYKEKEQEFKRISITNIGKMTDTDITTATELFRSFSACESLKWTGASKALHVRNPRVFVMWDQDIRMAYHSNHSWHDPRDCVTCYGEFMKTNNDIAKALLEEVGEDQLASLHPDFERTLFKRTLAKMMDEYNFAVIKPLIKNAGNKIK